MQSFSNFDWVGKTVIWVGLAYPWPCLEPALVTTVFLPSKTIEDYATVFCCLEDTPTEMFTWEYYTIL